MITAQSEGMEDVGLARYDHKGYSNCQEIHPIHFSVNFQKFSTLRVLTVAHRSYSLTLDYVILDYVIYGYFQGM